MLVAVGLLLVSCTSAEPTETTPPQSSTVVTTPSRPEVDPDNYTMDEIVDGAPLDWRSSFSSDLRFLDIVRVGNTILVLATGTDGRGLWAWSSTDGLSWDELGQVVADDAAVGVVGSTGAEVLISTVEAPGQGTAILRSADGATWTEEPLPDPDNPLLVVEPMALGGSPSLAVVAATSHLDARQLLAERLASILPAGSDLSAIGLAWDEKVDEIVFRVLTPLGFVAAELTGEQLALTDAERAWLVDEPSETALDLWVQSSGGQWEPWALEGVTKAFDVFDLADGEVFISGESPAPTPSGSSLSMWRTFEGFSWDRVNTPDRPLVVDPWGERRIGPSATGESDLLVGDDFGDWARTDLALRFPVVPEWFVTHAAGEESGVVAGVESGSTVLSGFAQLTLEKDGWTLVAERPGQILLFDTAQESFHEYHGGGSSVVENLSIDLPSQTVTFRDENGADLVTFTFAELSGPVGTSVSGSIGYDRHALAYAPDASSWTLWDLEDVVGVRTLGAIGLAQGRAIVAVVDPTAGFEITTAQVG